jgi:cation diffusion facilitator CzcD-associated flavoprotein CzcO
MFEIRTDATSYRSKTVILASGFFGMPYIPDIPGMRESPIVSHSHQFVSFETFRNKRVIIIGSGNSAAETAILLAGYAQVFLLCRGELQFFSKTRNLCNIRGMSESLLLELIDMEIIRYMPDITIRSINNNTIHLNSGDLEAQAIICATGYNADLSALGTTSIDVDKRSKFPHINEFGESTTIDNLYFAGPLAFTRTSNLLIHGFIKRIPKTVENISEKLIKTPV